MDSVSSQHDKGVKSWHLARENWDSVSCALLHVLTKQQKFMETVPLTGPRAATAKAIHSEAYSSQNTTVIVWKLAFSIFLFPHSSQEILWISMPYKQPLALFYIAVPLQHMFFTYNCHLETDISPMSTQIYPSQHAFEFFDSRLHSKLFTLSQLSSHLKPW